MWKSALFEPMLVVRVCCALLIGSYVVAAHAHDASTYGGMFRSRDQGDAWFSIDTGVFIGGALGIAVHPSDPNHLLLATDAGLLRSHNGGRDWVREPQPELDGPVHAVAFDSGGTLAWAATAQQLLRADATNVWHSVRVPDDALPAQLIVPGSEASRVYLMGVAGFFKSDDAGATWRSASAGLPPGELIAFAMLRQPRETLYIIANSALWRSIDSAQTWQAYGSGLPQGQLSALHASGERLFALANLRIFVSDDRGASWRSLGQPIPETNLMVRGLAASRDARVFMLTSHKGVYRSADGGETWVLKEGNLPIHLEAGPLSTDPHSADTFYAGYALTPYGETWRRATQAREERLQRGASRALHANLATGVTSAAVLVIAGSWLWRRRAKGGRVEK